MNRLIIPGLALALMSTVSLPSFAAVSPDEAAKLKTTLTPTGAERAGNADGTIPAWTGGLTSVPAGVSYDPGTGKRPNWFPNEKPVISITSDNVDKYADKLTTGTIYLLKNYPGYRMEIYPTHRTFAAPQVNYDGTFANATNAKLDLPMHVTGASLGIPFPIPQSGFEAIQNCDLFIEPSDGEWVTSVYYSTPDGLRTLTGTNHVDFTAPYYYPPGRPKIANDDYLSMSLVSFIAPAYSAGQQILNYLPADWGGVINHTWTYLPGQRRVRKLPNAFYDYPNPADSGMTNIDEVQVFEGPTDRYDWKLLGKKEIYVPYNSEILNAEPDISKVLGSNFVNPDYMRWELHRVWVLEGDLAPGEREVVSKRILYVDEDSWLPLLADEWDANGGFWKTVQGTIQSSPDMPISFPPSQIYYNLQTRAYVAFAMYNGPNEYFKFSSKPMVPSSVFSVQSMAQNGVD